MLDLLMFPLRILLFKLSWLAEKSKLYADCVSYLKTVPFELSFQSTQLQHNIYEWKGYRWYQHRPQSSHPSCLGPPSRSLRYHRNVDMVHLFSFILIQLINAKNIPLMIAIKSISQIIIHGAFTVIIFQQFYNLSLHFFFFHPTGRLYLTCRYLISIFAPFGNYCFRYTLVYGQLIFCEFSV